MNLEESLLNITGKNDCAFIAKKAIEDKKTLVHLLQFYTNNHNVKDKLPQRAAWVLGNIINQNSTILQPYLNLIVQQLNKENVHPSIIRNAVHILQTATIPEELQGEVMNTCFKLIEKPTTEPAIKAFSLTTLFNLSKIYPEIKNELIILIEELWDNETAAFKSRGRKILKDLKKANISPQNPASL